MAFGWKRGFGGLFVFAVLAGFSGAIAASETALTAEFKLPENSAGFAPPPNSVPDLAGHVERTKGNYILPELPDNQNYSPFGLACDVEFTATKSDAAMVLLNLHAPCQINTPLTVQFQGLIFSGMTTNIGHFSTLVPAVKADAVFVLTLAGNAPVSTAINVAQANEYHSVAVQWSGRDDLQIHAFERGAIFGNKGHVWAGAPQSMAQALQARGGYIIRLGDVDIANAYRVEIYSFPMAQIEKPGIVRVHVKAKVTKENCGQQRVLQILQNTPDQMAAIMDVSITMPSCDRIGDYLLLKNLLRDLKIGGNHG